MRTIEEITKDLNASINDVSKAKEHQVNANKEADELVKKANTLRSEANGGLNEVQSKAVAFRKEYEDLMKELLGNSDSRVRQS